MNARERKMFVLLQQADCPGDLDMEKDSFCHKHNRKKDSVRVGDFFAYSCEKCRIENERGADVLVESRQRQAAIKNDALIAKLKENCHIPKRFEGKTLSGMTVKNESISKAVDAAWDFAHNAEDSMGLILLGSPGTGKTHIAAGLINHFLANGRACLFVEAIKIFRAVKESWKRPDRNESDVLKAFVAPDILVIDEVGVQHGSETEKMFMTEIINDRYNALKATILCGNLSPKELKATIGERAFDRFKENGAIMIIDAPSHRRNLRH